MYSPTLPCLFYSIPVVSQTDFGWTSNIQITSSLPLYNSLGVIMMVSISTYALPVFIFFFTPGYGPWLYFPMHTLFKHPTSISSVLHHGVCLKQIHNTNAIIYVLYSPTAVPTVEGILFHQHPTQHGELILGTYA